MNMGNSVRIWFDSRLAVALCQFVRRRNPRVGRFSDRPKAGVNHGHYAYGVSEFSPGVLHSMSTALIRRSVLKDGLLSPLRFLCRVT